MNIGRKKQVSKKIRKKRTLLKLVKSKRSINTLVRKYDEEIKKYIPIAG